MRIVRYIDDAGVTRWGCGPNDAFTSAERLTGDLVAGLTPGGNRDVIAELLPPVEPRAILCVGLNYREHAEETGQPIPDYPVLFMKNPAALNAHGQPIVLPKAHIGDEHKPEVDYECELAVVIGKDARDVAVEHALDHVRGYTIANDVSARRWQKHSGAGQYVRGKSFDTFCPLGPVLVTPDELGDPQSLQLTTRVNDRVLQDSSTADMIFPVAELIAELSRDLTLLAGTVILTGTPPGVGVARKPQVFLAPGDVVTCSIEKIGALVNPVVAGG